VEIELIKFISQVGAIGLSVTLNIFGGRWIVKILKDKDDLQEKRLAETKEFAKAMGDVRLAQAKSTAENMRTIDNLTKLLRSFGGKLPESGA